MNEYFFILIAFVVVGIIALRYFFSKKAIIRRKLKKAPYRSLSRFKTGDIGKVIGKVEFAEEALIAPLSGRECAYFHVKVEERVKSGKSHYWKTIIEDEDTINFLIREEDKCALVEDHHIRSYIVQDRNYSSGFLNDADANLEKFLQRYSRESTGFLGNNRTLRYQEGILELNEEVAVMGEGDWKEASEFGLPEGLGQVLSIKGVDQGYVYLSDDPGTLNKNVQATQRNKMERRRSYDRRSTQKRRDRYDRRDVNYKR